MRHIILANFNILTINIKSTLILPETATLNGIELNVNIIITKSDNSGQIVIFDKKLCRCPKESTKLESLQTAV